MAAGIFRSGGAGKFVQGAVVKSHFWKIPPMPTPAGPSNGFYLFNETTMGHDYLIVGDTEQEVANWFTQQPANHGFWNQLYMNAKQIWGQEDDMDLGRNIGTQLASDRERKAGMSLQGYAHGIACPVCGKTAYSGNDNNALYDETLKQRFCSAACQRQYQVTSTTRKKTGMGVFPRRPAAAAPAAPPPAAAVEQVAIPPIYLSACIMTTELRIEDHNPMVKAAVNVATGLLGFAPGGNAAPEVAGLVKDTVSALNDARDNITTYITKKPSAAAAGNRAALRPGVRVSLDQGDGGFAVALDAAGQVTFAQILAAGRHTDVLGQLRARWASAAQ